MKRVGIFLRIAAVFALVAVVAFVRVAAILRRVDSQPLSIMPVSTADVFWFYTFPLSLGASLLSVCVALAADSRRKRQLTPGENAEPGIGQLH
ncbi:MAG: hypothetical protein NTV51_26410 [Verrucomicrobia bacterium]|nr:hypothetical protein [Verrucomicrobiota bacterium]